MELSKERLYKELLKKYAFEIARLKQKTGEVHTKDEQYSILIFYHMSSQLTEIINEYFDATPENEIMETYSHLTHLLFLTIGNILNKVDEIDSKYSNLLMVKGLSKLQKEKNK